MYIKKERSTFLRQETKQSANVRIVFSFFILLTLSVSLFSRPQFMQRRFLGAAAILLNVCVCAQYYGPGYVNFTFNSFHVKKYYFLK